MKRNYQPKKRKRARTHGYRARLATKTGRRVIQRRMRKGRTKLAVYCLHRIGSLVRTSAAFRSHGDRVVLFSLSR